ncbi:MAG: type II toxin-antitoxin system HicB family antitoxin [Peptococcaceae bacterium]|nr:type II toxin-antitoxin system HicB family antitoxin [Peptococcaceae bacterium]MBQ6852657.1 type II toxin-antitoxin system HicB family antitoxin [Peptococcaceae bacterium]
MSSTMEYKGYVGSVEFSEQDGVFFGKVMGVRALISYEGTNASELVQDFHTAVDDYLILCEEQGIEPEKGYKGSFNVRVSPELHRMAAMCAAAQQISLNSFVEAALKNFVMMQSKSQVNM